MSVYPREWHEALRSDGSLRQGSTVHCIAELPGSKYLLCGDQKGVISAWDMTDAGRGEREDAEHHLEAHDGAVTHVITLRCSRLPEFVEDWEWPDPAHDDPHGEMGYIGASSSRPGSAAGKALKSGARSPIRPASPMPPIVDGDPRETDPDEVDGEQLPNPDEAKRRPGCCSRLAATLQRCVKALVATRKERSKRWLVASVSDDGTLRVWRWRIAPIRPVGPVGAASGKVSKFVNGPFEVDFVIEWISDGRAPLMSCVELHDGVLAIATKNCADIRIVDPTTSTVRWVLFGHIGPVTSVAELVDGRLVSGGQDGAVRLWAKRSWERDKEAGDRGGGAPTGAWDALSGATIGAGVSATAFYAHMYQSQKGDTITPVARAYIKCGQHLPRVEMFRDESDLYVTCAVVEGHPGFATARTPSKTSTTWNHTCSVPLRQCFMDNRLQQPECMWLDFEVFSESRLSAKSEFLMAHWSVPLSDILDEVSCDKSSTPNPKARQLHAPIGEEPTGDTKGATLLIGFAQRAENLLECLIVSASGLSVSIGRKAYARVTLRQSATEGTIRHVLARTRVRTKAVSSSSRPFFGEVLELALPAFLQDRRFIHGPELQLHFEVYDVDSKSEQLIGTLTVPVKKLLDSGSGDVQPFQIELESSVVECIEAQRRLQGPRAAAIAGMTDSKPVLWLGFQVLLPCPKQLRCTIEGARLRQNEGNRGGAAPQVRMRFVEGNPSAPLLTTVRTSTQRKTGSPFWGERCVLPVPRWLRMRQAGVLRPASVRAGWEHAGQPLEVCICFDVYHRGSGSDELLCHGAMVLNHAIEKTRAKDFERATIIPLIGKTDARLIVAFEPGPGRDQLTVLIDHAENLPMPSEEDSLDPYCLVTIAEIGAFGQPTHAKQAEVRATSALTPPSASALANPVWHHEELLELPGCDIDGIVAVRPNWHLVFEVVDSSKGAPVAQASVALTNLLSDLWCKQAPAPTPTTISASLEKLQSSAVRPVVEPEDLDKAPMMVARQLPLLDCGTSSHRIALLTHEAEDPRQNKKKSNKSSGQSLQRRLHQAGLELHQKLTSALMSMGVLDVRKDDSNTNAQSKLSVRFEIIDRWEGPNRGSKRPKAKPMSGPSAVTCLAPLVSSVVAGHADGNVVIWDTSGPLTVPLHHFEAHQAPLTHILVLSQLDCILTMATELPKTEDEVAESSARLWSCSTIELRQTISMYGSRLLSARSIKFADTVTASCVAISADTKMSHSLHLHALGRTYPVS